MYYLNYFWDTSVGFANWVWGQVTFESSNGGFWGNYFWYLIIVSFLFLLIEWSRPWRIDQPKFRKDFWLDGFYMFFNFFLIGLIGFQGLNNTVAEAFNDFLGLFGIENLIAFNIQKLPFWANILMIFILKDFMQWWTHRLLHRVDFLWEFHKVHHSVEQMGFAAQLRFHWFENIVYKTIQYLPLAMLGFGLGDYFLVDIIAIFIGHWNHANFTMKIGPLKYIFNNPEMHIWHHAYDLPEERKHGVNFGLSLSIWDYLFGTNYIPHDGRDIRLGFKGIEEFPQDFMGQITYGFKKKKD